MNFGELELEWGGGVGVGACTSGSGKGLIVKFGSGLEGGYMLTGIS